MERFTRTRPKIYGVRTGDHPEIERLLGKTKSNPIFIYDDSWHAQVVETVGVVGNELTRIETPDSKPFFIVALVVGRGRRNRYVVSDGEVYADVHGEVIPGNRTHRRQWCRQKGPWKIVASSPKKLNQNAKTVIQAAIKGALLLEFKTNEVAVAAAE